MNTSFNEMKNIDSIEKMREIIDSGHSKSKNEFKPGLSIVANNIMDKGNYNYTLTAEYGDIYSDQFKPYFTPEEMLTIGVFEGKYLNDCILEFPREWYEKAITSGTLSPKKANIKCNYFGIKSRMSLQDWINNGWIPIIDNDPDNRGWFQWYCRYYIGRRIPELDDKQIKRWRSFKRHFGQVTKNCIGGDLTCRRKQRQALLQWSYNAFV